MFGDTVTCWYYYDSTKNEEIWKLKLHNYIKHKKYYTIYIYLSQCVYIHTYIIHVQYFVQYNQPCRQEFLNILHHGHLQTNWQWSCWKTKHSWIIEAYIYMNHSTYDKRNEYTTLGLMRWLSTFTTFRVRYSFVDLQIHKMAKKQLHRCYTHSKVK